MGVLKALVGGVWVPVSQGFSLAQVGYVGLGVQGAAQSGLGVVETDITGMTVTWTADPTHRYKTTASAVLRQGGTAGEQFLHVTNAANGHLKSSAFGAVGAGGVATHHVELVETGLSGAQTRKARVSVTPGTAATNINEYVGYLLVEDITPVNPNPAGLYPQVLTANSVGGTVAAANSAQAVALTTGVIPSGRSAVVTFSYRVGQPTGSAFDMILNMPSGLVATHQYGGGVVASGAIGSYHRVFPGADATMAFNITINNWGAQVVTHYNTTNISVVVV